MMINLQLDSLVRKLGLDSGKFRFRKKPAAAGDENPEAAAEKKSFLPAIDTSSSLARALGGPTTLIEEFYFPPDIIGGMCPQVPGAEEETAWNAAAEACDTERVHIVWQSFDSRVWYLAIRSADLAAHANSWCPFAALLPGMKEALTPPVCYTFYGEEIASMMTVTDEGLHVYRGTNPIVRAKAERTARELGNAAIVDLVPERIVAYTPVPWYSVSLFEERARRVFATASVALSLALTGLSFLVWLLASVALVSAHHNLDDALLRTQGKTLDLLSTAQGLRATPVRDEMTKFVDLNEGLLDLNGYLEVYAIKGGKVRWRATVPTNVTADRINGLGGKTIDAKPNGTVIGNAAEIEYEAAGEKK
jgi:hypothetical protein